MPYQTRWYLAQKVYYVQYHGDISYDDAVAVGDITIDILNQAHQTLYMLFDMRAVTQILPTLKDIKRRPEAKDYYTHPNLGWTIYIGSQSNPFFQFMTSALAQKHGMKMRWTYSEAEARAFLHDLDESIPLKSEDS